MRILVFDTETTGLPKSKVICPDTLNKWPHIVQFSYVIFDTSINELIETQNYIIKVGENVVIPPESTQIHGITNEASICRGIPLIKVLREFFNNLRTCQMIVGHNISFDINMVRVELLRIIHFNSVTRKELYELKTNLYFLNNFKNLKCTMKKSIELCSIQAIDKQGQSYLKFPKLVELHQKLFDSVPNNLHNSFNDVLITLRCFIKMELNKDLNNDCLSFQNFVNQIGLY
jgi:DNA polymerase III epsilon subunit-like protein